MLPKVTNEINTSSEDVIKLYETNSCKIQRLIFFFNQDVFKCNIQ